jgi:ankyrin repeat domain-containing protein 50
MAISDQEKTRRLLQKELAEACYYGDVARVKLLLELGARWDLPDQRRYHPLRMACQEGEIKTVELLLEHGANLNSYDTDGRPVWIDAVGFGATTFIKYLIQKGVDVSARTISPDDNGTTALHLAAAFNRLPVAKLLIKAGAQIDALDGSKRSPIFYAVMYGYTNVVKYLVSNGANLTIKYRGKTVDDIAAKAKNTELLKILESAS